MTKNSISSVALHFTTRSGNLHIMHNCIIVEFFLQTIPDSIIEPLHGVLGSQENGGQNHQEARSRVGKSLGSREQRK